MTYITPTQAKDEVYELVTDQLVAWLEANNVDCDIRYQGKANPAALGEISVRFSMQQVLSTPRGFLATDDGEDEQVFETSGLFFCAVKAAISTSNSFATGDLIATAVRNMVRQATTQSGLTLVNARYNEIPSDAEFYKWNVVAEYEYDERNV